MSYLRLVNLYMFVAVVVVAYIADYVIESQFKSVILINHYASFV